ncbi:hypothetical protein POM88_038787 [Heracleum sosnowskyi]|uniref:Uncharacterized protein n=1 Tax=Heracleum sosnowskyi TaxID=360622 RepID=A0AAD8M782_9APIA|nr:hypothetical protein POM88_038787 [Heracleum sosnowskyi]
MSSERPPGFDGTPHPRGSTTTSLVNRQLNFDSEGDVGPLPTPEEQRELILRWREEHAAKKGKQKVNEQADKEAQIRAKKKEADMLRLKAIKLRREELELEEKALRESLEEVEVTLVSSEHRRDKRPYDDEDESSDSESHPRRTRSKITMTDSDEEDDSHVRDRIR